MSPNAAAPEAISMPAVAIYATASFVAVSVFGVLLYITCARRYRLNWFEQNLLETERDAATAAGGGGSAREPLVGPGPGAIAYNVDDGSSVACAASAGPTADPAFWVPASVQRQLNAAAAANATAAAAAQQTADNCSADESLPLTAPASPTGSQTSAAYSIGSAQTTLTLGSVVLGMGGGGLTMPIARSDRHVVLSTPPPPQTTTTTCTTAAAATATGGARPKVSSMQVSEKARNRPVFH